jgi:NAD(P)H-hydrate repair Nnr-like enzyme with NAD(P)H-hydrate epimerase domain
MSAGAFSIDQLMELAGLSVSQAGKSYLNISSFPQWGHKMRRKDNLQV